MSEGKDESDKKIFNFKKNVSYWECDTLTHPDSLTISHIYMILCSDHAATRPSVDCTLNFKIILEVEVVRSSGVGLKCYHNTSNIIKFLINRYKAKI